ncbi:phosphoethanolamine--lipid A transferase [Phyllobacterium sp. YR531]|uniref:phosphoethanolamine transferase n=1 Tax=Phyllobacterium sp. YR531 TaxID=1144343 RepID=UPI00026F7E8F|nr:phosphoethanolamine--lipid A transferase [Phyllobacterium sp. YR531]EJN02120.1 putative membrane-associated, metal-dependent hydrolase [Phyllobacterium sp. YR531]
MSVAAGYLEGSLARPKIGSVSLSVVVAVFLIATANATFWGKASVLLEGQTIALVYLAFGLTCAFVALCVSFSLKFLIKPFLIILLLFSASTSWFMDSYGTIIDVNMLQSVIDTTDAEAGHLMTPAYIWHMLIFGIAPALLVGWVRVKHRTYFQKLKWNMAIIAPALVFFVVAALSHASTYLSLGRENRDWFATLNPIAPIVNVVKLAIRTTSNQNIVVQPLGTDARVYSTAKTDKPRVTIIIAGETARAESFSLGGYYKNTNPELSKQDITYFPQTSSCGTITEVSLPCMFSVYTRKEYTYRKGLETENLMDVLGHAGIKTEWWDNNTGDKKIAKRTTYQPLYKSGNPAYCKDGECLDSILLDQLDNWLDNVKTDSVLVIHQLGSHGPAYYLRYPEEFRHFTPDCRTSEFAKCTRQEIINSYDNTILYTDHIISTVINKLKERESRISPSMIYMSDHGESTGEYGLYLHGAPYFMAPTQQTHVPFVLWLGQTAKSEINASCLASQAPKPHSHDNLFHTVLGMMHVETAARDKTLDALAPCRQGYSS